MIYTLKNIIDNPEYPNHFESLYALCEFLFKTGGWKPNYEGYALIEDLTVKWGNIENFDNGGDRPSNVILGQFKEEILKHIPSFFDKVDNKRKNANFYEKDKTIEACNTCKNRHLKWYNMPCFICNKAISEDINLYKKQYPELYTLIKKDYMERYNEKNC